MVYSQTSLLTAKATPWTKWHRPASSRSKTISTWTNNLLYLDRHLHAAFDKHRFYIDPFEKVPIWLGWARTPLGLIYAIAAEAQDLPLGKLLSKTDYHATSALFADSCRVFCDEQSLAFQRDHEVL